MLNSKEIGNRIKIQREQCQMTLEDIASKLQVSKSTILRYERGEFERIKLPVLNGIASVLGVNPNYLCGKVDDPYFGMSESLSLPASNIIPMPQMQQIPLLGTIACGEPILAQENIEGTVAMPSHVHADFALRCKGDSMINARIFDGDIVYIRHQETVSDGEIAAVLVDEDEATLKRVRLFPDHVSLEPENPQYRPLVFWGEEMEKVRIIGKAVAFTSTIL